jgi:hypothetical protein
MALASGNFMAGTGGYGTTLATKLDKIDMSQVLAAVLLADKQLLGHIRMGAAGTTIEHNWLEDELSPAYILGEVGASTTITLITSLGGMPATSTSLRRIVRTNAILQPAGKQWLFQKSTNNATVLTGATYGNTTAGYAAITTVTKMYIIANPYTDVADASDDISQARSKKKNFMQIFERAVAISQTRKNMDMEAVVDELQLQLKYRTMEIKRELDMSVLRGFARGLTPSGSYELRTMAGIIQLIRDPDLDGGTYEDTTVINAAAALTLAGLNSLCYKVYSRGGLDETADPIIVVGPKQQRIIASFEKELRRVEQGERITGYYRDIFLSDMGVEFPIVLDRWVPDDNVILLDRSRVALIPLQGDAWHIEKMSKTGRTEKWQISGQYTLELRLADKCHGLIYGLT